MPRYSRKALENEGSIMTERFRALFPKSDEKSPLDHQQTLLRQHTLELLAFIIKKKRNERSYRYDKET